MTPPTAASLSSPYSRLSRRRRRTSAQTRCSRLPEPRHTGVVLTAREFLLSRATTSSVALPAGDASPESASLPLVGTAATKTDPKLRESLILSMSSSPRNAFDVLMKKKRKSSEPKSGNPVKSKFPDICQPLPGQKKELQERTWKKPKAVNVDEFVAHLTKKPAIFDPKSAGWWEDGEKVPFLFLAKGLDLIRKAKGVIQITDITCNLFRTVIAKNSDDLICIVYLLANRIAPSHEGVELGIGDPSLIKALAEARGATEAKVKNSYDNLGGDLGGVAKVIRSKQPTLLTPPRLSVSKVFNTFQSIAKVSGKDSQERKNNLIKSLIVAAKDCEPVYLMRLLQSKLRIGLAEETLLVALGQAAVYPHSKPPKEVQSPLKEAGKIVQHVYSVLPVYDKIIHALLNEGVWNLSKTCHFTPGVPIVAMKAKPTTAVSQIIDKFQDTVFTCEYKYDGVRAHIHYMEGGSVEMYSRSAKRNTGKYPDVLAAATRSKKSSVTSFVLDCEIVAYDREKKEILEFQKLSTRARKNVVMSEIKVDVCIFAFDMLYLNGKPLLQEQLNVRRKHLLDSFEEEPGLFQFATSLTSNDLEEIQEFLIASVSDRCEGLIIKTLDRDATYEPSKRSNNWLKLKKDYMDGIGDSLDLVPIAAFHGRGNRTGVYGSFILACYNSSNEEYESICKIGTGFTEDSLKELSASLGAKVIPNPKTYYQYAENIKPDVWFEPSEVWEVKASDLTISPEYRAAVGLVDPKKGISLRFPRFVRFREDKAPEDATSAAQVAEMYNTAQENASKSNKDEIEDDD